MTLEDKFILTRWLYSILEEPLMTDQEYNAVLRNFQEEGKLIEYTSRTWSDDPCPVDLLDKYGMPEFKYDIQLADKTESMPSITSPEVALTTFRNMDDATFLVSYKEDGINLQKTYYNGRLIKIETRGRKTDSLDLSSLISIDPVQRIDMNGEVKVIGEAQLSYKALDELRLRTGKSYVFPRTSIRGAIANKGCEELISFHAFDIKTNSKRLTVTEIYKQLEEWGFTTPKYQVVKGAVAVMDAVKTLSNNKEDYGFETDGTVVRSDSGDFTVAVRLYGWAEEIYRSYVYGYEETPSDVYYGCKLLIRPCKTKQGVQRRLNITNLKNIQDNNLRIGYPVAFTLRSGAIADIDLKTTRELHSNIKDYERYRAVVDTNNDGVY